MRFKLRLVGLDRGLCIIRASPRFSPISAIFLVEASRFANYTITRMLVLFIDVDWIIEYPNAKLLYLDLKENEHVRFGLEMV